MRLSLGFEPAWFHKRCGVRFTENWHKDPTYRYDALKKMKAELNRRFPQVPYWARARDDDLATVSGCYGVHVIARVFGLPLRYAPDRWPVLEPGKTLSIREIEKLDPQKLLEGPFVEELFRQMELIESKWGKVNGYLNWQGILNNAFQIRGRDIFLDMYQRPGFVHAFFSKIKEVMIELAKVVQERQRQSGFYIDQLSVSNCTMNMISREMYREFLLCHDRDISYEFERFGVHTCNWNINPYVDVLKKLPKIGYLDMGMETDMARVKATFPKARRAVIYGPMKFQNASYAELQRDMLKIYRELSPCDVVVADIRYSTPDERVHELLEICKGLEAGGREESFGP